MADLYLSFPGNIAGHLRMPHDIRGNAEARRQFEAHAPGIKFPEAPLKTPSTILYLEHCVSDTPHLVASALHATLHAPKGEKFPADMPHLLYGLERKALLQQNLYPVHAACVGRDGEYMLLVGHSGSGKTTLAHKLVEESGFKLFSGNKTVVRFGEEGLKAIAGTRVMTALKKDFNRRTYEMQPAEYAPEEEVRISRIATVRINDGVEECPALKPASALHTLYPYFLDTVNADIVVNGKDVFSGPASDATKQYLAGQLGAALKTLPVHKISGSMAYMQGKAAAP